MLRQLLNSFLRENLIKRVHNFLATYFIKKIEYRRLPEHLNPPLYLQNHFSTHLARIVTENTQL